MSAFATTAASLLPSGFVAPKRTLERLRRRAQLRRIIAALFEGDWRAALIDTNLTRHKFRAVTRTGPDGEDKIDQLIAGINLIETAMLMHADVVAGNPVLLSVEDEQQWEAVNAIRERCLWDAAYHEACVAVNIQGECPLRVDLDGDAGGAVIDVEDADCCLPVGELSADNQPKVWERRWVIDLGKGRSGRDRKALRIERHLAPGGIGRIENEAYLTEMSDPYQWTGELPKIPLAELGIAREPVVLTGVDRPLIVQLVNYVYQGEPRGRLNRGDVGMVDALIGHFSDLSRTLKLHGSPKVRVGTEAPVDANGLVNLSVEVIQDPERAFEYIQTQFAFDAMMSFLGRLLHYMLIRADMAAALVGIKPDGGAAPDSYDKLRLEATPTLAAAKRAAVHHGPAIGRAFRVASALESNLPGRGFPVGPVQATVRPELPRDRIDRVREQREEREAGLVDQRTAIAAIHGEERADEILAAIRADEAAETARQQAALFGAGFADPAAGGAA